MPLRGALFETLHPPSDWRVGDSKNDAALVFRLSWPGVSVLFTGDIEERGERAVAERDCRAAILKVPHHGSATSSSDFFLDAVAPSQAIVSTRGRSNRAPMGRGVAERYAAAGVYDH